MHSTLQSKSNNIVQQKFDIHRIRQILSINIEESPCFLEQALSMMYYHFLFVFNEVYVFYPNIYIYIYIERVGATSKLIMTMIMSIIHRFFRVCKVSTSNYITYKFL